MKKKILILLLALLIILTGCGKAELEAMNESLTVQVAEKDVSINNLNTEIENLNETIANNLEELALSETQIKELTIKNKHLLEEKELLTEEINSLKGPDLDVLLGSWDNKVYSNDYIGVTLTIPDTWKIADDAQLEALFGVSKSLIEDYSGQNTDTLNEIMLPLFYATNDFDISTSTMTALVTKTLVQPEIKEVLEAEINSIEEMLSAIGSVSLGNIQQEVLGGKLVHVLNATVKIAGTSMKMNVSYYYFYIDNYFVTFSVTYLNSEKEVINSILESITFK